MWPRLAAKNGADPHYLSDGDILGALDEGVLSAAMFSPLKSRSTLGAEQSIGFANGLTLYPNHIALGVRAALDGADATAVAEIIQKNAVGASRGMQRTKQRGTEHYVKSFAESKRGAEAIAALAENIVRPDYLARLRGIDEAIRPVAQALELRYADNIVERAGERIIAALKNGGDRGTIMKVLRETDEWASAAARDALHEGSLVSASVAERLDTAVTKGVLGEDGYLDMRFDWNFARATEDLSDAQLKARQARVIGDQVPDADLGTAPSPQAFRESVTKNAAEEARHAEASVRENVAREYEAETGKPLTPEMEELFFPTIAEGMLRNVQARLSGKAGMRNTFGIRTSAEERSFAYAAAYSTNLRTWLRKGARDHMSRGLGKRVTPEQALEHVNGRIWRALAATNPENWGSREALAAELAAGRALPDTSGPALAQHGTFDALTPWEVDMALDLQRFIDHVLNPERTGFAGRSGLHGDDVLNNSPWIFRGENAGLVDGGLTMIEQAQIWRTWGDRPSPLDDLNNVHQAMQAATVPQIIGHQIGASWGHEVLAPGRPVAELYAEGWRRIDPDAGGVGRFMDKDAYFPPEVLKEVANLNEFLAMSRGFDPESGRGKFITGVYDPVNRVFKSMNTVWRPGHHVTNVLGEQATNLMDGVNPLQTVRAIKAIKAGGGMLDADIAELAAVARGTTLDGKVADPKFSGDTVQVVLRSSHGGRPKIVELSMEEVWRHAAQSGAALTHTAARDLLEDVRPGMQFNAWRDNPVARMDEALGQFSAWRDNTTRIAHFIDRLEKGTYASIEDAVNHAAHRVHDFHPTIRTMSRFEQKYARRMVFFYSWVRQMISVVIRTALDRPGLVTMPFKAQYNIAEAAGLNPESIGGATSDDPRLRDYTSNAFIGPTGTDSSFPFNLISNGPEEGRPEDLWSLSLSFPQMDALEALFGTSGGRAGTGRPVNDVVNNTVVPALELGGESLSPWLSIPGRLGTESKKPNGIEFDQIVSESAGLPTAIARSLPSSTMNEAEEGEEALPQSVYSAMFPNSAGARRDPAEQQEEMRRYLFNLITGLKVQNVTSGGAEKGAKAELREQVKRELAKIGVTDTDEIDRVRDMIWERDMAQKVRG